MWRMQRDERLWDIDILPTDNIHREVAKRFNVSK